MQFNPKSAKITLWANRLIGIVLFALLFLLPTLLDWYSTLRHITGNERIAILTAFYICAVFSGIALWNLDKVLRNILLGRVFTWINVGCIRRIQWCCGAVSLVCFPAAVCYPPLIFLAVIMAFLFLVVSVLTQVMAAAVAIREENDLTI